MEYWVWSIEHNMWWRPNHMGYTNDLSKAGKYNLAQAQRICEEANEYLEEGESLKELYFPVQVIKM